MFDFIDDEDKNEEEPNIDIVFQKPKDDSLESKLDRLKLMKDKGVLPEDMYLQNVNELLKENGL